MRYRFFEGDKISLINGTFDDNHYKAEIEKLRKIIGKQAIQIEILKNREAIGNKIRQVEMLKEAGYTIKDACSALSILRSDYYSVKEVRVIE